MSRKSARPFYHGRAALVTGASRGLGLALWRALRARGAVAVGCSRRPPRDPDARRAWIRADVGRAADVRALWRSFRARYGRPALVINNASVLGPLGPLTKLSLKGWNDTIRANLTSVVLVAQGAVAAMDPAKEGAIVNISSGAGRRGKAGWAPYAVSKFGVEGLTQVLALELARTRIAVLAVNPGATRTGMRASAFPQEDPQTLPAAEDVAEALLDLLDRPRPFLHGRSLDVRDRLPPPERRKPA